MKSLKLTPKICYMAGLVSKSHEKEKSAVGIQTSIDEIEQRFVEIAVKELSIEPNKIIVQEMEGHKHIMFYHSRVSKQLKEITEREIHIFKKKDNLAASYLAGMFDGAGHVTKSAVTINPISTSDAFMLENLGIHTKGNSISNIRAFVALIEDSSALLKRFSLE